MQRKFVVIGPGNVGQEVITQAPFLGLRYAGALGRSIRLPDGSTIALREDRDMALTVEDFLSMTHPDIAFVTTPPFGDEGKTEMEILLGLSRYQFAGATICTKEVLAHRFGEFKDHILPYILGGFACNASGGGETGIPDYLKNLGLKDRLLHLQLSLNASFNFLLWRKHNHDEGLEGAHQEAVDRHYLEPGKGPLLAKLNRELWDKILKTCFIFNLLDLGGGVYLSPPLFQLYELTQRELDMLAMSGNEFRLVVNICNTSAPFDQSMCGKFSTKIKDWRISGGIRMTDIDWIPEGASAAVQIKFPLSEVPLVLSGAGAGASFTARRMIMDAAQLLRAREAHGRAPAPLKVGLQVDKVA